MRTEMDVRPVAVFGTMVLFGVACLLPADLRGQAAGTAGAGQNAAATPSATAKPDGKADVEALGAALDEAAGPPASSGSARESAAGSASGTSVKASDGVRIVRLSQVKGEVKLDRGTGHGLEPAFANLPIARGQRLETKMGVAEVEFEDNSSVRLTPDTAVEFPTLSRSSMGATTSGVTLLHGMMFASLATSKSNDFFVNLGRATIRLTPGSHIRLETGLAQGGEGVKQVAATPASSRLTVLAGSVQVENPSGTVTVDKKKALLFDATGGTPPLIAKAGDRTAYDDWDKTAADYHRNVSMAALGGGGSGYAYGVNDMNYYGSFADLPGCGSMWRPYFANAAFDPFANGVWAWYPGAGYSWVSPYPWGWTPFHSGTWAMCGGGAGGAGMWGWRPGGQFVGLTNGALYPQGSPIHPKPPAAPTAARPTYQVVNLKPLTVSTVAGAGAGAAGSGKFEFRNGSAGLGVPREGFGNLSKISAGVQEHGTVSRPAASMAIASPGAGGRGAAGAGLVAPVNGGRGGSSATANGAGRTGAAGPSAGPSGGAGSMSSGSMGGGSHASSGSSGGGASHK